MQGWTTTMMALQMCDQVDLYGFQPYRGRSDQERYHYFDNQVASLKVRPYMSHRATASLTGAHTSIRMQEALQVEILSERSAL